MGLCARVCAYLRTTSCGHGFVHFLRGCFFVQGLAAGHKSCKGSTWVFRMLRSQRAFPEHRLHLPLVRPNGRTPTAFPTREPGQSRAQVPADLSRMRAHSSAGTICICIHTDVDCMYECIPCMYVMHVMFV